MKQSLAALIFSLGAGCCFFFSLSSAGASSATQFGIVDCFGQGNVHAARVRGVIVDPTGVPLSDALVSISGDRSSRFETKSDAEGRFSLRVPDGNYILKVEMKMFAGPEVGLDVSRDVANLIHPKDLKVLIGVTGMSCPWVTTDDEKFKHEIAENKKRLQESAKKNATQK